ncbi:lactonase family protein [Ulvibacterium marinum]|uniref:lactonase family protein n=1 Tax=Ulvibacterium marinum TaxID=2419782 RepID=UPI0024944B2D|nr:lactonase family protein [Ulvibacterium marinum]
MTKKTFISVCCLVFVFLGCTSEAPKTYSLFVGTYTNGESEGIYRYTFNTDTGTLEDTQLAATLVNPSFLKISSNKEYLYSVKDAPEGKGAVAGYRIKDGLLEEINSEVTNGPPFCHVGISQNGRTLAASSYPGGSISIFRIDDNGKLLSDPQYIDHKIIDTTKTSHAHAAKFTSDGLFVADLGLDAVKRYAEGKERFAPAGQASLDLPEKAGPRHFTFSPDEKFLYVINELNSTITVFERKVTGDYEEVETQNTLAMDFDGKSYCADIHLSKDGQFLYGSNRGENTIVIFKVDASSGKLNLVGRESVRGDWPRNFAVDPTDGFLLVANQKSDNITVFQRDKKTGELTYLHETKLSSPVCLEFLDL